MKLTSLISQLTDLDASLTRHVNRSANMGLTIRNWLVGAYLVEYEQSGEDRAEYGEKIVEVIAQKIKIKGLSKDGLWRCKQFYEIYPQILAPVSRELDNGLALSDLEIVATLSREFKQDPQLPAVPPEKRLNCLSFSHFRELVKIENPLQLAFYKKHEISDGDNPPIGLLLCTYKDQALVEYALGDMDKNMFVSTYKVALPDEVELQAFLNKEARFLSIKN